MTQTQGFWALKASAGVGLFVAASLTLSAVQTPGPAERGIVVSGRLPTADARVTPEFRLHFENRSSRAVDISLMDAALWLQVDAKRCSRSIWLWGGLTSLLAPGHSWDSSVNLCG